MLGLLSAALPALVVIEHTLHKQHRPPPGVPHAEIPARIDAAAAALKDAPFAGKLDWREAGVAVKAMEAMNVLLDVHTPEHISAVRKLSQRGGGFDTDTYCAPGSWEAMVDGTAAWMEAVQFAAREEGPALALARPPGHHATRSTAMGFCLVNFAAAAARSFLDSNPSARISILDWDVHHGNGVADILSDEPRARYASTHEAGSFPRTGLDEEERGPHGNLLHLPLPAGSSGTEYLKRLRGEALPFLLGGDDGPPDVLLVCAGYDALDSDPLAGMSLQPEDFAQSVKAIVDDAGFPASRIALGLEGGYDLDSAAGMPGGLSQTCAALIGED